MRFNIRAIIVYLFLCLSTVPVACRKKAPEHPVQNPPKQPKSKFKKRMEKWFGAKKKKDPDQESKQSKVKKERDGFGAMRKNRVKKRSQIEHGLFPKEMHW